MKKLGVINSLRGIAILMVIYQHLLAVRVIGYLEENVMGRGEAIVLFGGGLFGVTLFFILSGFVLYKPYVTGERSFKSLKDIFKFYKHRFLRIYPLLLISCLVITIFVERSDPKIIESTLLSVSTLSMYTFDNFFPLVNSVLWSLSVEIWFSVFFPFIVILINKFGIVKTVVLIVLISLLVRYVGYDMYFINMHVNPVKDHFLARIDDMVVGMGIAYLFYKTKIANRINITFLISGILLFFLGNVLWYLVMVKDIEKIYTIFANNIFQLAFAFITLNLLKGKSLVSYFLKFYPLQYLGMLCYSLYIWHGWLMHFYIYDRNDLSLQSHIEYFVVLVILSSLTYYFIEMRSSKSQPEKVSLLKLKHKIVNRVAQILGFNIKFSQKKANQYLSLP